MEVPLSIHVLWIPPSCSHTCGQPNQPLTECVHISTGKGTPANKYRCSRGFSRCLTLGMEILMHIHQLLTQEVNISVFRACAEAAL